MQPLPDPAQAQRKTADLQAVLETIDLQQLQAEIFLREAASAAHRFQLLADAGPLKPDRRWTAAGFLPYLTRPQYSSRRPARVNYEEIKTQGINALLELEVNRLQFSDTAAALTLEIQGRGRLLLPRRQRHSQDLAFREVTHSLLEFRSKPHAYEAWGADDGALLRAVLNEGLQHWSHTIISHWFF